MNKISSPYQVEIKVRNMLVEMENVKNKKRRSIYGTDDEENDEEEKFKESEVYEEVEKVFSEAFKKFPSAEFLYLWSGLFQIHFRANYILAMVQAYKGLSIANKVDSQYILFYFKRMSESFYKSKIVDDAYNYVQWEKYSEIAKKNDVKSGEI
jgi:hypothetical protein